MKKGKLLYETPADSTLKKVLFELDDLCLTANAWKSPVGNSDALLGNSLSVSRSTLVHERVRIYSRGITVNTAVHGQKKDGKFLAFKDMVAFDLSLDDGRWSHISFYFTKIKDFCEKDPSPWDERPWWIKKGVAVPYWEYYDDREGVLQKIRKYLKRKEVPELPCICPKCERKYKSAWGRCVLTVDTINLQNWVSSHQDELNAES